MGSAHYYYEKITDDGNCFCHIGSTAMPGRPDSMGETWILSTRRSEAAYATIHYSAGNDGSGGALGSRYNLPGARSTLYWEQVEGQFKRGDRVECNYNSQWRPATYRRESRTEGYHIVKYDDVEMPSNRRLPTRCVRRLPGHGPAPAPTLRVVS